MPHTEVRCGLTSFIRKNIVNNIKNISLEFSPWKGSIRRFLLKTSASFLMVYLCGCAPVPPSISPALEVNSGTFSFPPEWTGTATPIEFPRYPTNTTTLTQTVTETPEATTTTEPSSTKTAVPTHRPTPTRGLPPTITLNPKEECPPPTYAKVEIHSADFISDYGPQILNYFQAFGDRAELEEQLERIGHYEERTINAETGETKRVFVPNVALFTEVDLTGDQVKETLITLKQQSYDGSQMEIGVFIVGCRDHQFRMLHSEFLTMLTPSESRNPGSPIFSI